jgi:hypothetical protein
MALKLAWQPLKIRSVEVATASRSFLYTKDDEVTSYV